MTRPALQTVLNRDLEVLAGNRPRWNQPPFRRYSFQNFSQITRYSLTFRSPTTLVLTPAEQPGLRRVAGVQGLLDHPFTSALCIVRDGQILLEHYARDFRANQAHAMQSITKTMVNLMIGRLVAAGLIDLSKRVKDYIPEICSGYSEATLQQVLNMDVQNDYSEDWSDPRATVYRFEEMCRRLPLDPKREPGLREFLQEIRATPTMNEPRVVDYKSTNTSVLAWVIERVGGIDLRLLVAEIIDEAGLEGQFSISCDRYGIPLLSGGGTMTARDLARYGSIFTRWGVGVGGKQLGSAEFIAASLKGGVNWSANDRSLRYCNQLDTDGRVIAHGGYCGQYLIMDMVSGMVAVYFSTTDSESGQCSDHFEAIWAALTAASRELPDLG
ncbi:MAG: serine hydrolase domain-containing protein [Candidatus Pacebacteria bacterium]|nr:serine hydrolase domain-containing protein [Candidatus Paceibacterota bacterium]